MKMPISSIIVDSRIREELGDISSLEMSIKKLGLLNAIIIDENNHLVAGFRRLYACKRLEMAEVDVRVFELGGDTIKKLEIEYHENFGRKALTTAEVDNYIKQKERLTKTGFFASILRFFVSLWAKIKSIFTSGKKQHI